MSEGFIYELDVIGNVVEVAYKGFDDDSGLSIFSYSFDEPLDSVKVATEDDPWEYVLADLHAERTRNEEENMKLGDFAVECFEGPVKVDVESDSYVEVEIPAKIEDYEVSLEEAADWMIRHLDEIEERYAYINNISNRKPEEELSDWIAEETGRKITNR